MSATAFYESIGKQGLVAHEMGIVFAVMAKLPSHL